VVRLLILGLLAKRPMHGYEIKQYLEVSRTDQWAGVPVGSIYHALKKLESEGFIAMKAIEQTGNRTRAVYEITQAGQAEFKRLLFEAWRTPSRALPSTLYAAMTFLDDLPTGDVLKAIDEQIDALEKELADWNAGEAMKTQYAGRNPVLEQLFQNGRDHFEADLKLLRNIRELLPRLSKLEWSLPPLEEST